MRKVPGRRSAAVAVALAAVVAVSAFLIGREVQRSTDEQPRTFVMDDFESGALTDWQAVGGGSGGWFVYTDARRHPIPLRAIRTFRSISPIRPRASSRR